MLAQCVPTPPVLSVICLMATRVPAVLLSPAGSTQGRHCSKDLFAPCPPRMHSPKPNLGLVDVGWPPTPSVLHGAAFRLNVSTHVPM